MHVYATRVDLRTRLCICNSIHGFAPLGIHRRYSILSKKKNYHSVLFKRQNSIPFDIFLVQILQAGKDM